MRKRLTRKVPLGWVRNASIALALILVVTVGGVIAIWFASTLTIDQRIAAISATLTASALAVAVLAAVLAIAAYLFTIRLPDLQVGFTTTSFDAEIGSRDVTPYVYNNGSASASSARVLVTLVNAQILSTSLPRIGPFSCTWEVTNVHRGSLPLFYDPITLRLLRKDAYLSASRSRARAAHPRITHETTTAT
jgi:hypothetical protein